MFVSNGDSMKSIVATILLITGTQVCAAELPFVKPEKVGFSSARLQQINEFAKRNVDEGKHVGIVTMVARHGKIVHFSAVGKYGIDNDKPMEKDTLFRIYSMTKAITSVAAMMLYEEGRFQLADPVSKYLPEFKDVRILVNGNPESPKSEMTIEQLMTHTAGLTYGNSGDDPVEVAYREANIWKSRDLNEFVGKISAIPLRFEPGSRYHYSVATDILGAVIERISGQSLESFFQERIFKPLDMNDTFFNVPEAKLGRLASNQVWSKTENAITLVSAEYNRPPTGVTLFSGGGGLISTAMDYMVFCDMLRRGGSFNGVRILGPKTVQYMTIDHLTPEVRNNGASDYPASHLYPGQSFGLGLGVITDPGQSQVISSKGEVSWGGAADTKYWIDPEEDLVVVLMTQLLSAPWDTRYQMKIATYQALTKLGAK